MPDDRIFESSPKVVCANHDSTAEGGRPSVVGSWKAYDAILSMHDAILQLRDDPADPVKIGLVSLPEYILFWGFDFS